MWLRRSMIACAAVAGVSAPAGAQKTFEGTITYDVTMDGKQAVMSISSRGSKVRQDVMLPGAPPEAQTYQIIDYEKREIVTVLPGMRQYITLNPGKLGSGANQPQSDSARLERVRARAADVSETGRKETIAGLSCEVYVLKSAPEDEVCLTTELGHVLAFEGRDGMADRSASPLAGDPTIAALMAKFSHGAAILRMRMSSARDDMTMVASKVERTPQPASYFAIPQGFTEINPMIGKP